MYLTWVLLYLVFPENFEKFYKEQHKKEKALARKSRLGLARLAEARARREEVEHLGVQLLG